MYVCVKVNSPCRLSRSFDCIRTYVCYYRCVGITIRSIEETTGRYERGAAVSLPMHANTQYGSYTLCFIFGQSFGYSDGGE